MNEPLDAASSARLARRLDARVLLPLFTCYLLCYLDRSNLANAKADVSRALALDTAQYAFASSCFQIGYILFEVPANLVLARSRPSLWLGALVAAFGAIAALSALARSYAELVAARIFLGIAEAGFPPGALFYLSLFYRPEELGARNALFLVAGPLANAAGAVVAFFLLEVRAGGLAGWQWLFVIEGAPAIAMGLLLAVALPDVPAAASFLSEEEKALAVGNLFVPEGVNGRRSLQVMRERRLTPPPLMDAVPRSNLANVALFAWRYCVRIANIDTSTT